MEENVSECFFFLNTVYIPVRTFNGTVECSW